MEKMKKRNKTKALGNATNKETKEKKKKGRTTNKTKAFLNASTQTHKPKQKQNIPNQRKTPSNKQKKLFIIFSKTHTTKTTNKLNIHTNEYTMIITKHQNTHQRKARKKQHSNKRARPTGLAQKKQNNDKHNKGKTPPKINLTNKRMEKIKLPKKTPGKIKTHTKYQIHTKQKRQ